MNQKRVLVLLILISSLSVSLFAGGFALPVSVPAPRYGRAYEACDDATLCTGIQPVWLPGWNKVDLGGTFIMPSQMGKPGLTIHASFIRGTRIRKALKLSQCFPDHGQTSQAQVWSWYVRPLRSGQHLGFYASPSVGPHSGNEMADD
jgi:hypothetical protein